MSPIANPLVGGGAPVVPMAQAAAPSADAFDPDVSAGASAFGYGTTVGADFTHPDNTNVHVAILVAISFGVIVFFHASGFRFAVDAGVAAR